MKAHAICSANVEERDGSFVTAWLKHARAPMYNIQILHIWNIYQIGNNMLPFSSLFFLIKPVFFSPAIEHTLGLVWICEGRREGMKLFCGRGRVAGRPWVAVASKRWNQHQALRPDPYPIPERPGTSPGCSDLCNLFRWCRSKYLHWDWCYVIQGKKNQFLALGWATASSNPVQVMGQVS